jgi:hypothetical protein
MMKMVIAAALGLQVAFSVRIDEDPGSVSGLLQSKMLFDAHGGRHSEDTTRSTVSIVEQAQSGKQNGWHSSELAIAGGEDEHGEYLPTSCYGVWYRSDDLSSWNTTTLSWLRGGGLGLEWSDFETANDRFDFALIDLALAKAESVHGCMYIRIGVGPESPDWIYTHPTHPVPKVVPECMSDPDSCSHLKFAQYPYYLDTNYKYLFKRMLKTLAAYLRSHPRKDSVGFVQANFGCTGDVQLYKDRPAAGPHSISDEQQEAFIVWAWRTYYDIFTNVPAGQKKNTHPCKWCPRG